MKSSKSSVNAIRDEKPTRSIAASSVGRARRSTRCGTRAQRCRKASAIGRKSVVRVAGVGGGWLLILLCGGWNWVSANGPVPLAATVTVISFLFASVIFGRAYHWLAGRLPRLDEFMPAASMAGIVYFTAVTTAAGRDNLLKVGGLLFLAAALHNAAGYCFGYWLSRASGLDKNSARSVAFEVGLQNGGMASGIAGSLGKLGTMGLAPAIFSPWMNISGSVLANYWRKRPAAARQLEVFSRETADLR